MILQSLMHIQTNGESALSRRSFLRRIVAGSFGLGMLGWKDTVTLHAEELRKRGMACVLLFMRGGPSQFETFDPKPGTTNGGPTKTISTAVSGIQIAEGWSNVAKGMQDIALIRSMTNKEGEHQRAAYQLHTGYVPSGSAKYPSLGSVVASELGPQGFALPHFVSIGNRATTIGSGFLGMHFAPFVVANPAQMPNNLPLPQGVKNDRFNRRLGLLDQLEGDFAEAGGGPRVHEHKALYANTAQMVTSPRLQAFEIGRESDEVRDRYGRTAFGQGCLLARRLVDEGVTFVEVESNGWDTHDDNFERVKTLTQAVDPGFAALVGDLKERGMLNRTLVIWIGKSAGRRGSTRAREGTTSRALLTWLWLAPVSGADK
jgi:hypothetical protein